MVADRSTTASLLLFLATIYPPHLINVFQLLNALDLISHYVQMYAAAVSGQRSHKQVSKNTNRFLRLYYERKDVLFWVCAGNEGFYLYLYVLGIWESSLRVTACRPRPT